MLDVLCEDIGWSSDNARRQLERVLIAPDLHKKKKLKKWALRVSEMVLFS